MSTSCNDLNFERSINSIFPRSGQLSKAGDTNYKGHPKPSRSQPVIRFKPDFYCDPHCSDHASLEPTNPCWFNRPLGWRWLGTSLPPPVPTELLKVHHHSCVQLLRQERQQGHSTVQSLISQGVLLGRVDV